MGAGMTKNLLKAGFSVFVYNRTKEKAVSIAGATVVDSPGELCEKAGIIITCVSNDEALRKVLFSENLLERYTFYALLLRTKKTKKEFRTSCLFWHKKYCYVQKLLQNFCSESQKTKSFYADQCHWISHGNVNRLIGTSHVCRFKSV